MRFCWHKNSDLFCWSEFSKLLSPVKFKPNKILYIMAFNCNTFTCTNLTVDIIRLFCSAYDSKISRTDADLFHVLIAQFAVNSNRIDARNCHISVYLTDGILKIQSGKQKTKISAFWSPVSGPKVTVSRNVPISGYFSTYLTRNFRIREWFRLVAVLALVFLYVWTVLRCMKSLSLQLNISGLFSVA